MLTRIRKDRFRDTTSKPGISSFYGYRGTPSAHVGPPHVHFGGPINDLYGPHITFGDPSPEAFRPKPHKSSLGAPL